jgi:hypothetical protein
MTQLFKHEPQPDITVWGTRISEPMTALTGLFVAMVCIYAWMRLGILVAPAPEQVLMRWFFATLAVSNIVGSLIGHAFLHHFGWKWKIPGWFCGMLSVALLAQVAIVRAPVAWFVPLTILNWGAMLLIATVVIRKIAFRLIELHAAFGLLLIMLPLECRHLKSDPASEFMLWALVPSVLAVLLHTLKFSPSRWFNFFDIGHLLLCATGWYFLLAAEHM